MSKFPSTDFGEPLSDHSLALVSEVRRLCPLSIHPNFDSDFNIYRFVANAERTRRNRHEILESAAKALEQHIRIRKCMKLDEMPAFPMEMNRLFRDRLMPFGRITEGVTDSRNRLLWFIEYQSMSVEKIANGVRSSESIRSQFWQFEQMLRMVNRQERKSGLLSSVRHVIDMNGYEINPFAALFVSSGTLSYYSQLFHYDNYPELIYPIELVNIAKWIHLPYRMIRGMMPTGFTDRFRLYDGNFIQKLTAEIPIEFIPKTLGGQNKSIRCVPASPLLDHWQPKQSQILDKLQCFHIGARKSKVFRVQIEAEGATNSLSWYLRTDGDIFFGVFFEEAKKESVQCQLKGMPTEYAEANSTPPPNGQNKVSSHGGENRMTNELEWIYPWLKLSARLHHEWDCVDCSRPGIYWLLFSNKHNWLHRRTIEVYVQIERIEKGGKRQILRIFPEGKESTNEGAEEEETLNIRECLQMDVGQMFAGITSKEGEETEGQ
ncbi:hypothetical protein niasHS_002577 [Heterodera schachtii]|uniref:CRAL-TRIO domain-containing protein n=1 Tax=Heterodera schachtii TaxID=97005 RepID=A0ABD2KKK4_HETSC